MERTGGGIEIEVDRDQDEAANEILRDRFRLCTISIAEAEAKKNGMEISPPIMSCISDLAFKYAEQLAKDLELFAQHAGRKSVNMEDVILCAHRNNHLAMLLRSFCNDLKAKEPPAERKKRKKSTKDADVLYVPGEAYTLRVRCGACGRNERIRSHSAIARQNTLKGIRFLKAILLSVK